ncbi:carbamoyltransferase HypF [soil metagenome]
MMTAFNIFVRGVVQGVGFRPFVYRMAQAQGLKGWILNAEEGVKIHLEGPLAALETFLSELKTHPPPAAHIADIHVETAEPQGFETFTIHESEKRDRPTVRISPDLPSCQACLRELFDPSDRRCGYPYLNCTDCGPRYTILLGLPYDRPKTTMNDWPMCPACAREYRDPLDRRFHAQPVACPACGPHYYLQTGERVVDGDEAAIREAARMLRQGAIVAVKGLGGYHLACDARNPAAVAALRERKFRKEKPFALMVADLKTAQALVELSPEAQALLTSVARPVVLAPAKLELPGIAPGNPEFGVMLPYTPLHHLLFEGAPSVLVMTSANRSSEPIAYQDEDALARLTGIADAFLIGERPVARRVDDSVVRASCYGPVMLRRARGYAPGAVATLPVSRPVVALGADLKNTVTVVVNGQAFVSQHIGDLEHYGAFQAFQETIRDLTRMYELAWDDTLVIHDAHPEYRSTQHALELPAPRRVAVQHHRAHLAAVLAERQAWDQRVLGIAFDGAGYGDDGAIWGGEFFVGSLAAGLERVAHLRYAKLPGGDAAARHPVQAAAGFLDDLSDVPDLTAPPFYFGEGYAKAKALLHKEVRVFPTTSVGRLFDAAAALLGFTRAITFEGQAAIWLEHLARSAPNAAPYPMPFVHGVLDFRPLLEAVLRDCQQGRDRAEIARAFHAGLALSVFQGVLQLCEANGVDVVVLSGGVFQNDLLLGALKTHLDTTSLRVWTPRGVPSNDGGVSLGQAALGIFATKGVEDLPVLST